MTQTPPPPSSVPPGLAAMAQFKAQLARMAPEERKKAIAALAQVVKAHMQVDGPK